MPTTSTSQRPATTAQAAALAGPLLDIQGLTLTAHGLPLASEISLSIQAGDMIGLVGESGCGKSITALSILRLLPNPPIQIAAGRILFDGTDLAQTSARGMRDIRGGSIGMIFQEPMTSLNPVLRIGDQIAEPLVIHRRLPKVAALRRAAELLDLVGIAEPRHALGRYPHQLSGGQRQRVVIASAIACEPKLLIADEPTTALDVTVQAQVLGLINDLRRSMGMACLLITHDLGVVADVCSRASVMYAGRIVEEGPVAALFATPRHRYTRALVDTIPARNRPGARLPAIAGVVPAPGVRGAGCAFADRCPAILEKCRTERPLLAPFADGRMAACWNPAA